MADPRGRQPIGVNQPPGGGTNYPFVRPSSDIQYLLGDFYLSFPDDTCDHPYPFYVAWMYGFGTNVVTPPVGYPTPTHAYDILVKDANDVTVFDSTGGGVTYSSSAWAGRLLIHEWVDEDNYVVCRCTEHTEWTQADIDDGLDKTYDDYIVPTDGTLDGRTYGKIPQRVTKLTVGLTDLTGEIAFEEGYNIGLTADTKTSDLSQLELADIGFDQPTTSVIAGRRKTSYLTLAATPGLGTGTFPSCEGLSGSSIELRKLNGAVANEFGNVTLDTEDQSCLRIQRPIVTTRLDPREFEYYSPLLTPSISPFGTSARTLAKSAIEMRNDCGPCCDCEYFARTYQGLKRQWFFYQGIATDAEGARNTLRKNVARWDDQKICRESKPLSVSVVQEPDCKISHSAIFGNTSKCCLVKVHFRFTFYYYRAGAVINPPELEYYDCQVTKIEGSSQSSGPEEYALIGDYPVYEAILDYMEPQANGRVTFRFCFPGCEEEDRVKIRTDVYWEGMEVGPEYPEWPLLNSVCSYPDLTIDAETSSLWGASALGIPSYDIRYNNETKQVTTNPLNAYCVQCNCPPPSGSEGI